MLIDLLVIVLRQVSVPYRGITFLNENEGNKNENCLFVSVPYRGITFLNKRSKIRKAYSDREVSVPYRGITFLNVANRKLFTDFQRKSFRPLPGNHIS